MKTGNDILSHLYTSQVKRNQNARCLDALRALLPPRLGNALVNSAFKDEKLLLFLNTKALIDEFNYKRAEIRAILKKVAQYSELCEGFIDREIVILYSKNTPPPPTPPPLIYRYPERASGEFILHTKNPQLLVLFKQIQNAIKANQPCS